MARIPLPVPTSRPRFPSICSDSSSSMQSAVVSCEPVPNACSCGTMIFLREPSVISDGSGATTNCAPISIGSSDCW